MTQPVHPDVAIIGGGFAGCAAAHRLAARGVSCLVIEFKGFLGGRAMSYRLPNWPVPLDNGQHVLLGCCAAAMEFLRATGAGADINWHDRLFISNGNGAVESVKTWPLAAPFHLLPFLMNYPGIDLADKFRIAWGIGRMAMSRSGNAAWPETARRIGQTDRIRKMFWDPFLISALNAPPEGMGDAFVRRVIIDAFLRSRGGVRIGVPNLPLAAIFSERVRPALERGGAVFQTGKRVLRLSIRPDDFVIHIHDQSALTAKQIILATGPAAARAILEESTGLESMSGPIGEILGGSPIISIHLLYDRVLTDLSFCLVQNRTIQWIFNKGVIDGKQHLQAIISGADEWAGQSQMELVMIADEETRRALGAAGKLEHGVAFIEKNATFPPRPGIRRPKFNISPKPGLWLAGDYVDTGWPGTIESAVRSGFAAADACLAGVKGRGV